MPEEESLYLSLRPFFGGAMTCEINCAVSSVSPIGNLNLPAVIVPALADSCVVNAKVYLCSLIASCLCAEVKLFKFADSNLIHCSIAFNGYYISELIYYLLLYQSDENSLCFLELFCGVFLSACHNFDVLFVRCFIVFLLQRYSKCSIYARKQCSFYNILRLLYRHYMGF